MYVYMNTHLHVILNLQIPANQILSMKRYLYKNTDSRGNKLSVITLILL